MSENNAVVVNRVYSNEELAAIKTPDDAFKLALKNGFVVAGGVERSTEVLGNGFAVLPTKDKAKLVGVRFLIMSWQYNEGDQGEFVSANIVTKDGDRFVLNDGSTGILRQLRQLEARRREEAPGLPDAIYRTNLMAENGLRASDYDVEINGKVTRATTYYLA